METTKRTSIKVETEINSPVEEVWKKWTNPRDIQKWNNASDDWHTPKVENDLRPEGKFLYRMEAKDGSFGFDFWGSYTEVIINKLIKYTLGDGRKVEITFSELNYKTKVVETFDAEHQNPIEMQRVGWQAILNNFKLYVEGTKDPAG